MNHLAMDNVGASSRARAPQGGRAGVTSVIPKVSRAISTRSRRSASQGLGWFSIGLGVAELVAPGPLARLVGAPDRASTRWLLRALGVRELGAGLGLLSQPQRAGWLWGRVAGDLMDLSLLGAALFSPRSNRLRTSVAITAVLGVTALDAWAGQVALARGDKPISRSVTIRKPAREVYATWRELTNLPKFMNQLESVEIIDARRSRWSTRLPSGAHVTWDAELTDDRPGELIGWRASENALVRHEGLVRFVTAPDGKSTEVHVSIDYARGSGVGAAVKSMLAPLADVALGEQLEADLERLKQLLQIGHVMKSDASIHRGLHPARPAGTKGLKSTRGVS